MARTTFKKGDIGASHLEHLCLVRGYTFFFTAIRNVEPHLSCTNTPHLAGTSPILPLFSSFHDPLFNTISEVFFTPFLYSFILYPLHTSYTIPLPLSTSLSSSFFTSAFLSIYRDPVAFTGKRIGWQTDSAWQVFSIQVSPVDRAALDPPL